MSAAIGVRDLRVSLGGTPILHGVDLDVAAGEWVTVIGPNGAGKSTLVKAVGGLLPFTGTVTLLGTAHARLPRRQRARLIATVPQNPAVPPGMAVFDYVLLGRTPYIRPLGRESTVDLEAVDEVLSRLDLTRFAGRYLDTLSGGERQRVFLARALAQGATVLLLDEPTAALDIGHQQEVLDLVDQLRADARSPAEAPSAQADARFSAQAPSARSSAEAPSARGHGLTVLACMHDLSLAGEYADRMVLLAAGRVVAAGPPRDVLTEPLLREHYGARVRVIDGEQGPLIVPVRAVS
jgi:iron complex transport system ATP-binding protein